MGEVREFWIPVYVLVRAEDMRKFCTVSGRLLKDRASATESIAPYLNRFIVHVRLKPEGAPRRYTDKANQCAWEQHTKHARECVMIGYKPEELWAAPRTPKIEERT
jgi:hypothetical protein